ncbi:MAG: response regulator [Trueperaceae bacterium]|nr:response regulator [Trueperaceae bacterium]
MNPLGTLDPARVGHARVRAKTYEVVCVLGGGRDLGARMAGEASDVTRWLTAHATRPRLTLSVEVAAHGTHLVLAFAWEDAAATAAYAPVPAAAATRTYDGPQGRLTLRRRLRDGAPRADEVERSREIVTARSREELLAELRDSNEALRRSSREAELAVEAKAQFLANMSHEIRTPMNAIVGMNRLALGTDLTARQRNYLDKIESASRHLLGIIDTVLDASKLEAGKLTLERNEFRLAKVLEEVTTLVGGACDEKGLALTVDIAREVPERVEGDPLRLRQVLVNLVNNAVKFTDEGGIALSVARLPGEAQQVALRFAVRDTGVGMNEQQKRGLFTHFAQADPTITRRYGGTGLGLAISKSLAHLMGGQIGVESRVGVGSTFWFTARFAPAASRPLIRALHSELRGRRALVADDATTRRELLCSMLDRIGLHVEEATSGREALRRYRDAAQAPELVFVSSHLPDVSGPAVARQLRERARTPAPGVFLTATDGAPSRQNADQENGDIDGVLATPVDGSVVFETVASWFGMASAHDGTAASADAGSEGGPDAEALRGLRILLVEDNQLNQEVSTALLRGRGLAADVVSDGQRALDALRAAPYDLVFMDVQMPVLDGLAATRAIRGDPDLATLPVIAMTASALEKDRRDCVEAGMNEVVTKPIDPDDLWRALLRWAPGPQGAEAPSEGRGRSHGAPPDGGRAAPPAEHDAPDEADMNRSVSLETLRTVPGLDVDRGLRYAMGKPEVYTKILCGFFDDQRDLPTDLATALRASDLEAAERAVHTMRGLSSSLGATPLTEAGTMLEEALRHRAPRTTVERYAEALMDEHRALFSALEEVFEPRCEGHRQPVDQQNRIGGDGPG